MNIDALLKLELAELVTIDPKPSWSLGTCVAAACLLEAAIPKAGNVHPQASFVDMNYDHFRMSAWAIAGVFDDLTIASVGELVLRSIQVTQAAVGVNTNLGIVLMMAPIRIAMQRIANDELGSFREEAKPNGRLTCIRHAVASVLGDLSADDSQSVYDAIRMAKAGGMGQVRDMDIHQEAPKDLMTAMQTASAWDDIAKEYATGFHSLFAMAKRLAELRTTPPCPIGTSKEGQWFEALQQLQLERLAEHGDTLMGRKNEPAIVNETKRLAKVALDHWSTDQQVISWKVLDDFLRADQHRRNPGTTADLLAAATLLCILSER
jgi:triphosphoribosyl-dephospho-CoA synthase